ncbi:MAG: biliverdin-producing heme oxygenase [Bacteroidetes bacterium]|jgi:heme oxygenase|nr:biliverdin-producing heme oxygenase [Bacteroidota bacterium]
MLRDLLKERTFAAHQATEGIVIRKVKEIDNEADYIELLRCFYSFFHGMEEKLSSYVTSDILPDISERRNASYILKDIQELGGNIENLPKATIPEIQDVTEALSAMYVLEGSIMGGPYIVKMLEKRGITRGFSFFEGYGKDSGKMFGIFAGVLNQYGQNEADSERAVEKANETFINFGKVFHAMSTIS